ncbi:SPOR domain-containing protein [Lysobacter niastensis]|uniref:SPOR domain-containing protein n=1 Tax=Lysobacter niastensis TaxID=380629 RepID=A0ABS0B7H3_9GAMM|nr:SPOR domain-containing protein [Lysobacter niastensis]MBF6024984.1 SPOR domain-containing protein [Lysobacter niastensis]
MFVRALVILLLVLNLGVAAWWALHSPRPAPAPEALPLGVAKLQLLSEAGPRPRAVVASAPAAPEMPASTEAASSAPMQCFSLGPFADGAAATAARAKLQAQVSRSAVREQKTADSGRGWRVYLPAQPSPSDAQALAQRITAAGFSDLFVVRDGAEANSIALGRYRSEDTARRRAEALIAAGFAAQAEPLGEARTVHWLDVAAGPGFDAAVAQKAAAAAQRHDVACATVP